MYSMYTLIIVTLVAATQAQIMPMSATELATDMYKTCLKDLSIDCIKPKAMQWFQNALQQDELALTQRLSIVRTDATNVQPRALNAVEQMFDNIEHYLATHALRIKGQEYLRSSQARTLVPDFLMNNVLTQGGLVPLAEHNEGRGMLRKAVLPFLIGLKFKTTVLIPLALALIALKTWKAMTLGLLSLVLSGALVIFKIAKPKIVNYEVVHYPHHLEHIEHLPHVEHLPHIEHIVPHHLDQHLEIPHHVEHVEHVDHLEHPAPAWDPHAWARSSQEPKDAQNIAYAAQNK